MKGTKNPTYRTRTSGKIRSHGDCDEAPTKEQHQCVGESYAAKDPIEVRRIYPNPKWNGKCEMEKSDLNGEPHTSSAGEVIGTFDSPVEVWGNLRIDDVPIGEVLENSVITDLD